MQHAPAIQLCISKIIFFLQRKGGKQHYIVLALEVLKHCISTRGVESMDIRDVKQSI